MKAHIVFAHPNLVSLNGQLRTTAIQTLQSFGCAVTVSDLYQIKFKASADEDDFIELLNKDNFDLQAEQRAAILKNTFTDDIKREQKFLTEADLIILQFPLWWESIPALLKGYIDRVFSYGWAYGGGAQALAGKKVLVSITTGAPEFIWVDEKRGSIKNIFKNLFVGTLNFCGMQTLEPFIVYGAKQKSVEERAVVLEEYKKYLEGLIGKTKLSIEPPNNY